MKSREGFIVAKPHIGAKRAFCFNTMIHISDNRRVEIENCKKIIEYSDICVKLKTASCMVEIWGSGLIVNDFGTGGIVIDGNIATLELVR